MVEERLSRDERMARVLEVLVEEFIRTGEPVSSTAIRDRSGLRVSSATIRNDLAALESRGLVAQPHTSAGRIPTSAGYRFYVDHCSPTRLRAATRSRITSFFTNVHRELSSLLKDTSDLLSDITHYPAVVLGPAMSGELIRGLHLVPLGERLVLVVLVAESGRVSQELAKPAHPVTPKEVDEAERVVLALAAGRPIADTLDALETLPPASFGKEVTGLVSSVAEAMSRAEVGTRKVYVGGASQLAELWEDLAHVHRVLSLLERETTLLDILGGNDDGPSVRIGAEVSDLDIAVVSSPFELGDQAGGRLGVIGPMRMDYRRTIKVVEEVSDGLEDTLGS